MELKNIKSAPDAIGPYSHAVIHNDLIFCSGQIPLDPDTMEINGNDIKKQTHQVFKNLSNVLKASSSSLQNVIKTNIFLSDMDDFAVVNKIYEEYFGSHRPARSTVAVKTLPKNALIEIDAIALQK